MKTKHSVISILQIIILLIVSLPKLFGQSSGHGLVINEIMHSPKDEPEWIEIYNSSPDSINLKNFSIADNSSTPKIVISEDYFLHSQEFLVISDNDNILSYYSYNFEYIHVSLPSLNNSGDQVKLFNNLGEIIDSVAYDDAWGGKSGKSLERIKYEDDSNFPGNWGTSIDKQGATPGKYNSISPKDYDLAVTVIRFSGETGYEDSSVVVKCYVVNLGTKSADRYRIFIEQENIDLFDEIFYDLPPGESRMVFTEVKNLTIGELELECSVLFTQDMNSYNNSLTNTLDVVPRKYLYNSLVVNEIMYKPYDDEPEWFELYNRSNKIINLCGWKFTDEYRSVYLPDTSYYLYPDEYLVISARDNLESFYDDIPSDILKINLPSLNNTTDVVAAYDFHNNKIDSVYYSSDWGGNNYFSLERNDIFGLSNDSSNWHTCVDNSRATPGRKNTLGYFEYDLELSDFHCDSSYAVLGSQTIFGATIKNKGKYPVSNFECKLYDDFNRDEIFTENELVYNSIISNTEFDSLAVSISTDGLIEGENHLLFSLLNESDQNDSNNNHELIISCVKLQMNPGDLVINEIMYSPGGNEEEWIELYNLTDRNILLRGLTVCDSRSSEVWDKDMTNIKPHSYFIITKDVDKMEKYGIVGDYIECDFPTLNNTSDCIVIKDSLKRNICKVEYNSSWGGGNGNSLERISFNYENSDSSNWKTSNAQLGATPWEINSVSQKEYDVSIDTVLYYPRKPALDDNLSFIISVTNKGKLPASFTLKISESTLTQDENVLYSQPVAMLQSNEKRNIEINNLFSCAGIHKINISCLYNADEDNRDNYRTLTIYPSLMDAGLVINEIMYQPENNEPEWIELYNNSQFNIPLHGINISDVLTTPYDVQISSKRVIEPFSYFVIAKDTSIIAYHESVPSILVTPFANLNNSSDGVVIRDYYKDTIDSLFYGTNFKSERGSSLERISFELSTNDSLNWISSLDEERSTPGRKNSLNNFYTDIAVENVISHPETPIMGDKINLEVTLKNLGPFDCSNAVLSIYEQNLDAPIKTLNSGFINKNKSITLTANNILEVSKSITLKIVIDSPLDTCTANNVYEFFVPAGPPEGSVLINEFMCYPNSDKGEWIELFNASEYTIDLNGWAISDNSNNKKTFCSEKTNLLPGEYYVICNDSIMRKELTIQDIKCVSINFPALNNSGDDIIIYDSRGIIIDNLSYDNNWEINKGLSKEKKCLDCSSDNRENWLTTISQDGGTPGIINSVIGLSGIPENSLVINEIMFNPAAGNSEYIEFLNTSAKTIELASCYIIINNKRIALSSFNNSLMPGEFFVISGDSLIYKYYPGMYSKNIFVTSQSEFSLSNSRQSILLCDLFGNTIDSVYYDASDLNSSCYKNRSLERINSGGSSCDCYNWCSSVNCYGGTPGEINSAGNMQCLRQNDLVINEILFDPSADNGEFIEIYNRSGQETELAGCHLNIENDSYELTNILHKLPRDAYFVFAADSSILNNYDWLNSSGNVYINENINFSLPNSAAGISLTDHWNNRIDTVYYDNSFHNVNLATHDNISLERVNFDLPAFNSSNWNSCVDVLGATPGRDNSIYTETTVSQCSFEIAPNPFSPDNDGFEDFTIISYNLPGIVSRYRLRIFDCEGRLVRTLSDNQLTGSHGEIIFNGLNESGRPLRIGIYIALFEAADPSTGYSEVIKKPFVVARKF